jgi:hypothetical protein
VIKQASKLWPKDVLKAAEKRLRRVQRKDKSAAITDYQIDGEPGQYLTFIAIVEDAQGFQVWEWTRHLEASGA